MTAAQQLATAREELHGAIDFAAKCAVLSINIQADRAREEMRRKINDEIANCHFRARLAFMRRVWRR